MPMSQRLIEINWFLSISDFFFLLAAQYAKHLKKTVSDFKIIIHRHVNQAVALRLPTLKHILKLAVLFQF